MSGFLVNKSLLDPTVTQYSGGTASFTLPQSGSTNATEVFVGGVPQVAGVDFNVSGTALTLTTSAPAGANMVCARQYFSDGITGTPAANSVATAAIQNDSVTGGKLNPALVQGDLIYADGTDTITRLAKGTANQTLQMNGGATAPNWVTAGSGLSFISNTDISNAATYDFTAFAAASYEHYVFYFQNLIPATDDVHLWARTSTDGGSSYDAGASDYTWGGKGIRMLEDTDYEDSRFSITGDDTSVAATIGSDTNESGISGVITLFAPHATAMTHMRVEFMGISSSGTVGSSSFFSSGYMSGYRISAADVDGFRLLFESGNIESGTVTAYGLANA